jgi:hypothetical protein
MPPSGTLYAYPGMMPPDVQQEFVDQQNDQANVMDSTGSVHWEWFFAWHEAFVDYFPRYLAPRHRGVSSKYFFLNDVPWPVPIPNMWFKGQSYRILRSNASAGSDVVLFAPRFNWQSGGGGGFNFTAKDVADVLHALPLGSVQYIYIIQNTDIDQLFSMVNEFLDRDLVQLVGFEALAQLAVQRG